MKYFHLFYTTSAFIISIVSLPTYAATLQVFSSEVAFLAAAPIVSTETFDSFGSNTGFDSPVAQVDEVLYSIKPLSMFPACDPLPCWRFSDGLSDGPPPVTTPNYFLSNFIEIPFDDFVGDSLSFGAGRSAKALGFYLHSAISADWLADFMPSFLGWEIVVNEANGNSSMLFVDPSTVGSQQVPPPYFGFWSTVGITEVLISITPDSGSAPNWAYDNVSRSTIVPLPASFTLFWAGLGLLGLIGVARRKKS